MRFRAPLFALLFAVGSFALPIAAHAGIPFFGPIIPQAYNACPAGWGMLITVINNIIELLLTLAIVFVAPIMIAYSGFLFVVNPIDSGGISKAKGILTHTIVGIVIALSGWMIVDAVMAVLYNPGAVGGTWSSLIRSNGIPCQPQVGTVTNVPTPAPTVGVACSVPALTAITDSLAQQMEGGQTVIWTSTDSRLQTCVNKFKGLVGGGTVTSAYRPAAYQTHLWEIRDRWCTRGLKTNSSSVCSSLKSSVSAEVTKHFGSSWSCGSVGSTSRHTAGTGVDITGISHGSAAVLQAASQSCLSWPNYSDDPVHYNLTASCTCN